MCHQKTMDTIITITTCTPGAATISDPVRCQGSCDSCSGEWQRQFDHSASDDMCQSSTKLTDASNCARCWFTNLLVHVHLSSSKIRVTPTSTLFVNMNVTLSTEPMSFSPGMPMDNIEHVLDVASLMALSALRHLLLASRKAWCKLSWPTS